MAKYIVNPDECSRHTIFPGVDIRTSAGQRIMLSLVEFKPHSVVEMHQHPHEQMGMMIRGELTFTIGGETEVVRPGQMWRIPGGIEHGCQAGPDGAAALDVFCPVREDYL